MKRGISGFTIIELLVVIVVIGILAAITVVSYIGITNRAIIVSIQSDLTNASQQLKIYQTSYGSYPTTMVSNCPTAPTPDTNYCLKPSSGNTFTYSTIAPSTFHLTSTNNNISYSITDNTASAIATTTGSSVGYPCPTNFIPVPGSGTYGTNDFCVMKYEAKIQGNDNGSQTYSSSFIPESRVSGTPWVNISQTNAITEASTVSNCTACHLTTEAEWMTIAQNVLSVPGNWSGGTVGSGYIPRGNSDSAAATDATTDLTGINKRTLTLTNGQVIWDIAGNVREWTSNTMTGNQPGNTVYAGWDINDWISVNINGALLLNQTPAGIGITGSNTWATSQGIGRLWSDRTYNSTVGFVRGGSWPNGSGSGVMSLNLGNYPDYYENTIGFRVSR